MGLQTVRPSMSELSKWIEGQKPTSGSILTFDFHRLADACIPDAARNFRSLRLSHPVLGRAPDSVVRERELIEECLRCLIKKAFDVEVFDAVGVDGFFEKNFDLAVSTLGDAWVSAVRVRPATRASYVSKSTGVVSVERFIHALTLIHTGNVRGPVGFRLNVGDLLASAPRLRFDSMAPSVVIDQFVDSSTSSGRFARNNAWYFLCGGELHDGLGRNESWSVYLRRYNQDAWDLVVEGTDFTGEVKLKPKIMESLSAQSLVDWVFDLDELQDAEMTSPKDFFGPDETSPKLPKARCTRRLREIAEELGEVDCISLIDKRLRCEVSVAFSPQQVRILEITGVTEIAVWLRTYRSVYKVVTNIGSAYMYPPQNNGFAKVIFKEGQPSSPEMFLEVPLELMSQLEALSHEIKEIEN